MSDHHQQHQQQLNIIDEGPLPPGWTLTGLPKSMTAAFRQRAVHRIATRFIPMLRHRRNLRLKRQSAQSKARITDKELTAALRSTGSALFTLAGEGNADSIIEMCIEEGTLSAHSTLGEVVIYAGEPCAPSAWFLVRGRLDQFQGAISWHSPNLSGTGVSSCGSAAASMMDAAFPSYDQMCRKSYVYRHNASSSSGTSHHHSHSHRDHDTHTHHHPHHAAGSGLAGTQHLNKSTASSNNDTNSEAGGGGLSRQQSSASIKDLGNAFAHRGSSRSHTNNNSGDNNDMTSNSVGTHHHHNNASSSETSVSTETVYTCTAKGGLSKYIHGRRGGSEIRAPKCLSDLATIASFHFTSFYAVPLSSFDSSTQQNKNSSGNNNANQQQNNNNNNNVMNDILILRVPRQTIYKIYTRYMTADQRENLLLYKLPEFREHDMQRVLPLHPLQINESWLFRDIDESTLRMLTKTATPFALTQGQSVAQRGKRLAHILFIQRGLIALKDEKSEIKTILGPGSVYGEREALFRERLTVTVVALTNVDVLALSLKTVQHQISSSEAAKSILNRNAAARRQRDLHASFESSGGRLADSVKRTPLIPVPELAETLIPLLKPRVFSAGEHIVDSTSECDRIVYLTRGCAVVRGLRDENGGEVLFQRGECVGFTCLVSHRWERTIVAAEPVDTWELSRADFYKWLKKHSYSPSEEDLFYNKKFAQSIKKVLPKTVIPGDNSCDKLSRNNTKIAEKAVNPITTTKNKSDSNNNKTKLVEASQQIISATSTSSPIPSSSSNKKKSSGNSPSRSGSGTTTTGQGTNNNQQQQQQQQYTGPSHIFKDNGLVICQNETDSKTGMALRKFPHLYSLIVSRTLQLLQPFHVHDHFSRDDRLDRYTMNPVLHYGEDLAVQKKRTGSANHGFISLKNNNNNTRHNNNGEGVNVSFADENINNDEPQQQHHGMNSLMDASYQDLNLEDTMMNNNINDDSIMMEDNNSKNTANNTDRRSSTIDPTSMMDTNLIASVNDMSNLVTHNNQYNAFLNNLDEYELLIYQHDKRAARPSSSNNQSSSMMSGSFSMNNNNQDDSFNNTMMMDNNNNNNNGQEDLQQQRNTLPWLDTPNMHPTSFEASEIVYRPWIPPVRPAMTIASNKYFSAVASSPTTKHTNNSTNNNTNNDDYYDEDDEEADFDPELADKKAAGRGMLINLTKIRGPHVSDDSDDYSDDGMDSNDEDNIDDMAGNLFGGNNSKKSSSPSSQKKHHDDHTGGGGNNNTSKKAKRAKRRALKKQQHALLALKESSAAADAARIPMSTFTPTSFGANNGDYNLDIFGTLTDHTYAFTPATQFEHVAKHRALLEQKMIAARKFTSTATGGAVAVATKSSLMASRNINNQSSGAITAASSSTSTLMTTRKSTMPTSQEELAAFYDSLDHEFDQTGEFEHSPFTVEQCVIESDFVDILYPSRVLAKKRWKTVRTRVGVKDEEEQQQAMSESMKNLSNGEARKEKAQQNLAQMSQAIRDSFFGRGVYHRHASNSSKNQQNREGGDGLSSNNKKNLLFSDDDDDQNHHQDHQRRNNMNDDQSSIVGRMSSRPPLSKAVIDKCMKDHKHRIAAPRHQIIKLAKVPKNAVLRAVTPEAQSKYKKRSNNNNEYQYYQQQLQQQQQQKQPQGLESPSPSSSTNQLSTQTSRGQYGSDMSYNNNNNNNPHSLMLSQSMRSDSMMMNTHEDSGAMMLGMSGNYDNNNNNASADFHSNSDHHRSQEDTHFIPPMLKHKKDQTQAFFEDEDHHHQYRHDEENDHNNNHHKQQIVVSKSYENTTKHLHVSTHLTARPSWKPRPPSQREFLEKQSVRPTSARSGSIVSSTNNHINSAHNHNHPQHFSRTVDYSAKRQQQDKIQQEEEQRKEARRLQQQQEKNNINTHHRPHSSSTSRKGSSQQYRRISTVSDLDKEWSKMNYSCLSSHATSASEMVGSLLLNWRQATQNSKNKQEHDHKKGQKSILLRPKKPYQPEIDNPEFYYYREERMRRQRKTNAIAEKMNGGENVEETYEDTIDEKEMLIN